MNLLTGSGNAMTVFIFIRCMKRIAVLTSGGDAPGMNACIRAVVRSGIYNGLEVWGIYHGYKGLIGDEISPLNGTSVSNIIQRGGTVLKTARSEKFRTVEGRARAYDNLKKHKIEGVVAIGGDGTFTGAGIFSAEYPDVRFVGAPGTIDNDLFGTDFTIGYDTALNTVVEAVDKIRDTASSHDRLFIVEVMGKDAGLIALRSGIGVGAEAILIPETPTYIDNLIDKLRDGWRQNKSSSIIIVSEGDDEGGAYQIAEKIKARYDRFDTRVSVLGHMQRGGNPSAMDRVLASRLGAAAVTALLKGEYNIMVGQKNNQIAYTPFDKAAKHHNHDSSEFLMLTEVLSS